MVHQCMINSVVMWLLIFVCRSLECDRHTSTATSPPN